MLAVEDIPLGLYVNKDTVVHRMHTGPKLLILTVFLIISAIFATTIPLALAAVAIIAVVYLLARIPLRTAFRQLRGSVVIVTFFGALLWWRTDFQQAAVTVLVILSAIAAAICFTLTTRVSALMDTIEKILNPLSKYGVNVSAIMLAISLTIRLIPLQVIAVSQVLEARKARGAGASITAFGVPVIVRTIRRAQAMADALIARGEAD